MAEAATPASCVSPELSAGNLDSRVLSVVADNPRVLRRLVEDLGGGFRKVWYDLAFAEKRARGEPVAQRLLGVASGRSGAQVASQPDKPGSP